MLSPRILALLSFLLVLFGSGRSVSAADDTWTAASSSNFFWSDPLNWSAGVPVATTNAVFPLLVPNPAALPNPLSISLATGSLADTLTFNNGYSLIGGDLTLTTGTISVASGFTATVSSEIKGANGITLDQPGIVSLLGNNSFTGTVAINRGTLSIAADSALGNASNGITFGGTGASGLSLVGPVTIASTRSITLSNTTTAPTLTSTNNSVQVIAAAITGNGGLTFANTNSTFLTNASNTFKGPLWVQSGTAVVTSLDDSVTANGNIRLGNGGTGATFQWASGAATGLTLANRAVELAGTTGGATIDSSAAVAANSLTINTLSLTGAGAKTLTLTGVNGGTNIMAGNIVDNGGATALTKTGLGFWSVTGTNSYTGTTTVSNGTLRLNGSGAISTTAPISLAGGKLELRSDSSRTYGNLTFATAGATLVAAPLVDSNVTGRTLTFGSLTGTFTGTYNFDTNHNYGITFNNAATAGNITTTMANIGNGTVTFAGGLTSTAATATWAFAGNGDFNVTGNALAGTGTTAITKTGFGTLTMSGPTNTINGAITLTAGILKLTTPLGAGTGALTFNNTASGLPNNNVIGLDLRNNSSMDNSTHALGRTLAVVFNVDNNGSGTNGIMTLGNNISLQDNGWSFLATGANGYSLKFATGAAARIGTLPTTAVAYTAFNYIPSISGNGRLEFAGGLNFLNTTVNNSLTLAGTGDYLISGTFSTAGTTGSSTISKSGQGTVTLTANSSSTWNDATSLTIYTSTAGITRVTVPGALGGANAKVNLNSGVLDLRADTGFTLLPGISVGANNSYINVDRAVGGTGTGGTQGVASIGIGAFSLFFTGGTQSGANNYSLNAGPVNISASGASFINNLTNSGTVTMSSLNGTATNVTFNGSGSTIVNGAVTITTGTITKSGTGMVTLRGNTSNTTGNVTINAGSLVLDFNTNNASDNILSSTATLGLSGGTLSILGKLAGAGQTLGAVAVNAGGSTISITPNTATSTLTTGTLTATTSGGTLLVNSPALTAVKFNTALNTAATTGRNVVFFDGTSYTWASNTGANTNTISNNDVSAAAAVKFAALATTVGTDTANSLATDNVTMTGARTTNSLKITTTTTGQSLALGANTITLTRGGLLFDGANDYTISSTDVAQGLKSAIATASDLVLLQYGTGKLSINAPILQGTGTSTLTVSGTGTVALGGALGSNLNTYTGTTFVNGGTLQIVNATRLGASNNQALTVNGGTFDVNGNSMNIGNLNGGYPGTIDNTNASAVTLTVGNNTGTGTFLGTIKNTGGALSLVKTGTGAMTLGDINGMSSLAFTGDLTINGASTLTVAVPLADSASSKINLGTAVSGETSVFNYTGNVNMTLSNRQFDLAGASNATITSSGVAGPNGTVGVLTINTNLAMSGSGSKTLTFNGSGGNVLNATTVSGISGSGAIETINTFGGTIGNPSVGTLSVVVGGNGGWALTGANTFTGGVTMSSTGTLRGTVGNGGTSGSFGGSGNTITWSAAGTLDLRSDTDQNFGNPISWGGVALRINVDRAAGGSGYGKVMTLGAITQTVTGQTLTTTNFANVGVNNNGTNPISGYGLRVAGLSLTAGTATTIVNAIAGGSSAYFATPSSGTGVAGALVIDGISTATGLGTHTLSFNVSTNSEPITIITGDILQGSGTTLALTYANNNLLTLSGQTAATNFSGGLNITNGVATVRATTQYSLGTGTITIGNAANGGGTLEVRSDSNVTYTNNIVLGATTAATAKLNVGESINGSSGYGKTFTFGNLTYQGVTGNALTVAGISGTTSNSGASVTLGNINLNFNGTFGGTITNSLLLPGVLTLGNVTSTNTTDSTTQTLTIAGAGITSVGDITDATGGTNRRTALTYSGTGILTVNSTGTTNFSGGLTISGTGTYRATSATSLGASTSTVTMSAGNPGVLDIRSDTGLTFSNPFTLNTNTQQINVDRAVGGSGTGNTHTLSGLLTFATAGKGLTVTGGDGYGLTLSGGITTTAAGTTTITNNSSGLLNITGLQTAGLTNTAATTYTFAGAGSIKVADIINGTATTTVTSSAALLDITATNTASLGSATAYSGGFTISGGITVAAVPANFGTAAAITLSGGTLRIRNDNNTTFTQNLNQTASATLDLASTAYTATGKTITFGNLNQPATAASTTLTVNSGSGYTLSIPNVALTGTTGGTFTLVANTPVSITGNVTNQMSSFGTTNFSTLAMDGSIGGTITGTISDSPTGSLALNGLTRLTKQGTGTWVLNSAGANLGLNSVLNGILRSGVNNALTSNGQGLNINASTANTTAMLDLAGFNQTLGLGTGAASGIQTSALIMNGTTGSQAILTNLTGTSTLTLAGTSTTGDVQSSSTTFLGAIISVTNLDFGGAARTFNVAESPNAPVDLSITSIITEGGFGIAKTGLGLLQITNTSSTITGALDIQNGTFSSAYVIPDNANALNLGATTTTGALQYVGASPLTFSTRVITLNGTTGGGTLDSSATSSSNIITVANPFVFAAVDSGNKTITLTGTNTGNNSVTTIVNNGVSTTAVTKTGVGLWILGGANTYTGATTVNNGTLRIDSAGSLNSTTAVTVANSSGAPTFDINGTNATIGALNFGGASGTATTAGTVSIGTGGSLTLGGNVAFTATGNPTATQQITGGILNLGAATRTFTIADSTGTTSDLAISSSIQVTGTFGIIKAGAGTLVLSGASTFSGSTSIQAGVLSVGSFNSVVGGTATSNLGTPTTAIDGTIAIGNTTTAATLLYTGGGETTDRVINLAGTTGGATIDASGSGALVFSSPFTATGAGAKTLTLTGTSTAANMTNGIVNSSAATTVTKTGTGNWVIGGINTYTGGTNVQSGTLRLAGGNDRLYNGLLASGVVTLGTSTNSGKLVLGGDANGNPGTDPTPGNQVSQLLIQNAAASVLTTSGTGTFNSVIGGAAGGTSAGTPANNSVLNLQINSGFTNTYTGLIGWDGQGSVGFQNNINLVKSGGGTLVLSADLSNWTGTGSGPLDTSRPTLTISGGVLRLTSTSTINTAVVNTGGVIDDQGYIAGPNFSLTVSGGLITMNLSTDTISSVGFGSGSHGVGALNIPNNTAQDFLGSDVYLGAVGARVFSGASITNVAGSTYRFGGGAAWNQLGNASATLGASGGNLQVATTNVVTGASSVIIGDNGSYNSGSGLFGNASTVEFTANQDYTGTTTLAGGTFIVAATGRLGNPSTVAGSLIMDGGIFRFATGFTTDVSNRITIAGGATFDTNGQNVTFATAIGNSNTGTSGLSNGGLTKIGAGTLTLTAASNYAGTTTVANGTLQLNANTGSLNASSNLNFAGNGTFRFDNTGATATRSQTLGSLSFSVGDGVILSQRTAAQSTNLTFSALPTRTSGATGNFTVGGTGATTAINKVIFTTAPTAGRFLDGGLYVSGSNFAVYDAAGYVRAFSYGTDLDSTGLVTSVTQGAGTTISATDADVNVTGALTAQTALSIESLKISGAFGLTFASNSNVLTLTSGGLIKTGATANFGGAAGNGIVQAGATGTGELVVRLDASGDAMTMNSAIVAGALTKSGLGTLTLATANTITNTITINGGSISASAFNQLGAAPSIVLNGGTLTFTAAANLPKLFTLGLNGGTISMTDTTGNRSVGTLGDNVVLQGSGSRTLTIVSAASRKMTYNFNLGDNGGPTNLTINGGSDNSFTVLAGNNSYTGVTTITRGILQLNSAQALPGGLGGVTLTTSNTGGGNLAFATTAGANRAILELTNSSGDFMRSVGTGIDQVQWVASPVSNGGFSNGGTGTRIVNLGGASAQLTWATGGFVSGILQFAQGSSAANGTSSTGIIDFQNPIALGAAVRTVDVGLGNHTANTSVVDAIMSGALSGTTGAGFTKTGSGVLRLTGNNTAGTPANTATSVTGGFLIFGDLNAIPGSGANNRTVTATGNAAVVLDTADPTALLNRIVTTSTGVLALKNNSNVALDMSPFASLGFGAYSDIGSVPVYFSGTITPNSTTYQMRSAALAAGGGLGAVGTAVQGTSTNLLVLTKTNLFTDNASPRSVSYGSGQFYVTGYNNYSNGTTLNGANGAAQIGVGNDAAFGVGAISVSPTTAATGYLGALNGDHTLSNNLTLGLAGNFVIAGNTLNRTIANAGAMTYLGTINLPATAALFSEGLLNAVILGDLKPTGAATTVTFTNSSSGLFSLLTTPSGAVAKTYTKSTLNDNSTVVIDDNLSLGVSPVALDATNITINTSTLMVLPGVSSVTLPVNRGVTIGGAKQPIFTTPGGSLSISGVTTGSLFGNSSLTIAGALTGGTTGGLTKTGLGTLTLQSASPTAFTTGAGRIIINAGTLVLDGATAGAAFFSSMSANTSIPLTLGSAANGTFSNGGTLQITGTTSQNLGNGAGVSAVTVNPKANAINLTDTMALSLGVITRTTGSTLNFGVPTGSVTTTGTAIAGLVNGATTWNGNDWAGQSGSVVSAFTGYTVLTGATPTITSSATANLQIDNTSTGNVSLAAAGALATPNFVNTLKFSDSANRTLDVRNGTTAGFLLFGAGGAAGGGVTNAGGILVASGSGALTIGVSGTAGTIMAGGTTTNTLGDLVFINNSSNPLTINSAIVNNNGTTGTTPVVISGSGRVVLAGANTFTGGIIVNSGVLEYSNGSAANVNLGNPTAGATNIVLNGGALRYTGTTSNNLIYGVTINSFSAIDVPSATGTINQTAQGMIGIAGVAGLLQKTGAGSLTFSGTTDNANLSVQVVAGTLNLAKTSTTAVHALGGNATAALIIESGNTVNITGTGGDQILDGSSVVVKGTGIFNLGTQSEAFDGLAGNGTITSSGSVTLSLGGSSSNASATNNLSNIGPNTLAAAAAGMTTNGLNQFTGTISGNIALTKYGAGEQILAGTTTYSGATTIQAGTLMLGVANALPSGAGKGDVTIVGNSVINALVVRGTLDMGGFNQQINGLNSTTGGIVTNTQPLAFTAGAWKAGGVTSGSVTNTLTVGAANANGAFNGIIQDGYTIVPVPGTGAATAVTGVLALTKVGTGTLILNNQNTYTGTTTVNGGTLQYGVDNALPISTAVVMATAIDAVLDLNGKNGQIGSLSGGSATGGAVTLGAGTLTVNGPSSTSYAGVISGNGSLVKSGVSTLALTGNSLYAGGTTISGGTISVQGQTGSNSGTGTGPVAVNATGTLGGTGRVGGAISVASNGTLAPGITVGTLLAGNNVTFNSGAKFTVDLAATPVGTSDLLDMTSGSGILNFSSGGNSTVALTVPTGFSFTGPNETLSYTIATTNGSGLIQTGGVTRSAGTSLGLFTVGGSNSGFINIDVTNVANLNTGDWFELKVSGTGDSVILNATAAPEPSTMVGIAALGLGVFRLVRRRRTTKSTTELAA